MDIAMDEKHNNETGKSGFAVTSSDLLERIEGNNANTDNYKLPKRKTDDEILEEAGIQFNIQDNYNTNTQEGKNNLATDLHYNINHLDGEIEKELYTELTLKHTNKIDQQGIKQELADTVINYYADIKRVDGETSLNRLERSLDKK